TGPGVDGADGPAGGAGEAGAGGRAGGSAAPGASRVVHWSTGATDSPRSTRPSRSRSASSRSARSPSKVGGRPREVTSSGRAEAIWRSSSQVELGDAGSEPQTMYTGPGAARMTSPGETVSPRSRLSRRSPERTGTSRVALPESSQTGFTTGDTMARTGSASRGAA